MFTTFYTYKHTHGDGDRHIQTHRHMLYQGSQLYMWPDFGKLS